MMRKTDIIANEKFEGNIAKAIDYIMNTFGDEKLDEIVDEWTPEECIIAQDVVKQMAIKQYGKEKIDSVMMGENLMLQKSEIVSAKKNPYKAKIGLDFLKLLLVNGGLLALAGITKTAGINFQDNSILKIVGSITSVFTTCVSMDVGVNIFNYFKYNKQLRSSENNELGGKTL